MEAINTPASGTLATAPHASAVGWGAIAAGAVGTIAVAIILLTLGAGVGLTAVSPWSGEGATATTIAASAVIWMVVVQWLSAGLGGYLTGRLRLRWNYYDRDEVFFRDTAHGFLSWGFALVVVAIFASTLTAGVVGVVGGGAAAGAANRAKADSTAYYTDSLFRSDAPAVSSGVGGTPTSNQTNDEAKRIMARGAVGDLSQDDRNYLAKLVAQRTGMTQDDAQKRVDTVLTNAKEAADKARKAAATLAIATALSLAIGAFISAVAAGYGGRLRDE